MKQVTKEEVLLGAMDPCGLLGSGAGGSMTAGGGSVPMVAAGMGTVPLITCKECRRFKVVRRVLKQPWSVGDVFYYCPTHKVRLMFLVCISLFIWILGY